MKQKTQQEFVGFFKVIRKKTKQQLASLSQQLRSTR
jgi:hypothetical protein